MGYHYGMYGVDDDRHIVEECIQGNRKAQKALHDRYASIAYTVCYRYARNTEDAKDILQDTFMTIFQKLEQYKGDGSFEGWVRRVAVTTSIRFYKKNLKRSNQCKLSDIEYELRAANTTIEEISVKEILEVINVYRTSIGLSSICLL